MWGILRSLSNDMNQGGPLSSIKGKPQRDHLNSSLTTLHNAAGSSQLSLTILIPSHDDALGIGTCLVLDRGCRLCFFWVLSLTYLTSSRHCVAIRLLLLSLFTSSPLCCCWVAVRSPSLCLRLAVANTPLCGAVVFVGLIPPVALLLFDFVSVVVLLPGCCCCWGNPDFVLLMSTSSCWPQLCDAGLQHRLVDPNFVLSISSSSCWSRLCVANINIILLIPTTWC